MAAQPDAPMSTAEWLAECLAARNFTPSVSTCTMAAAELRRLHSVNAELLAALQAAVQPLHLYRAYGWSDRARVIPKAEAAIALATPAPSTRPAKD